jgi:hypothetical protein
MNSLTSNPYAANAVARQLIRERVQDAERHAQVRAVRASRRAARRAARYADTPLVPQSSHDQPWWTLRFLSPAR